jgi:hypothetical protein
MGNPDNDEKTTVNSPQEEEKEMPTVAKEEKNKGLSLSSKKLDEISVKPKVKNGKVLFDKNNQDHRYIVEEKY